MSIINAASKLTIETNFVIHASYIPSKTLAQAFDKLIGSPIIAAKMRSCSRAKTTGLSTISTGTLVATSCAEW